MKVQLLPVLEDNYIFILIDEKNREAAVVDPALAKPVIEFLDLNNLTLTKIFNTHHHYDHVGGNKELIAKYPKAEVYAGANDSGRIPFQKHFLNHNDIVSVAGNNAHVYYVPGHTLGHICYFFSISNSENHLFIGDTIFSGGCGKLFEGSLEQMYTSLNFLRENLPKNTLIWSAHEYTLENYLILQKLEPNNKNIEEKIKEIISIRKENKFTVPFHFENEQKTSSFFRWDDPELQKITNTFTNFETFCFVRKFRDNPPIVKITI